MFDFGNANDGQRKAISAAEGPVLITAGPGTGKTYTLVQRTIYLIEECNVKPESIFVATFTEKAAKELITRITNELSNRGIAANINEMYIGTFHSLCLRILKEHLEYTRLRRNYRLLDAFDQQYMVFQNIHRFRSIPQIEIALPNGGAWKQAAAVCNYVNNLSEELVTPEELMADADQSIAALGRMLKEYRDILAEGNLMDFSSIQIEAYHLLRENAEILDELRSQITHLMVDEYQDTNFIQEQLVFLLAGDRKNICVVGDDDQGLYRFRGATIRNILEFPQKFADGECRIIPLVVNYRSNSDIVDFYNRWMATTDGAKFKFSWDNFRYTKQIEPHEKTLLHSPAVVKLASDNDPDEWHEKILNFINDLKDSGKLTDYNQIAFLFQSVKHPRVTALARFLEQNHINVYSPRSDMFFQRDEIRLALGCLMLMFPRYVQGLENGDYVFLRPEHLTYYRNCIMLANEYLMRPENSELLKWIRRRGKAHVSLTDATDYAYCGLMYQLFEFQPFAGILDTEMDVGVVDIRPTRNLAKLTQIIGKFEYLHRVDVLDATEYHGKRRIDQNTEMLFNLYLRLLFDGGITEYEDDSEYAPSGCVSFLTIHQSKGMEFPIVLVDSLSNVPRKNTNDLMMQIEERYFKRPAFEPHEVTKFFDFWRLYYTAFSRAQDLLILTCNEDNRTPSNYFKEIYRELQSLDSSGFDIQEFDFSVTVFLLDLFQGGNGLDVAPELLLRSTCAQVIIHDAEIPRRRLRGCFRLIGLLGTRKQNHCRRFGVVLVHRFGIQRQELGCRLIAGILPQQLFKPFPALGPVDGVAHAGGKQLYCVLPQLRDAILLIFQIYCVAHMVDRGRRVIGFFIRDGLPNGFVFLIGHSDVDLMDRVTVSNGDGVPRAGDGLTRQIWRCRLFRCFLRSNPLGIGHNQARPIARETGTTGCPAPDTLKSVVRTAPSGHSTRKQSRRTTPHGR